MQKLYIIYKKNGLPKINSTKKLSVLKTVIHNNTKKENKLRAVLQHRQIIYCDGYQN